MKKITILAGICMLSYNLFSQNIYIKAYGGYGFGIQKDYFTLDSYYYSENIDTSYSYYSYEIVKLSNGEGVKFGLAVGTDITKNLAFELSGTYSKGKSAECSFEEVYSYDYYYDALIRFNSGFYMENKAVQITPEFVLKSSHAKIAPYVKVGAIIGFTWLRENQEVRLSNTMPGYYPLESWTMVFEYNRATSFGLATALGCEFLLFDNVYAFAEANYINLNCSPAKGEYTEYKYRGEDQLETLTDSEKYIEFVEEYTDLDNNDPDEPRKSLKQSYSLSNVGIMGGLRFCINFNKPKTE
jgi:hypothetical protein